MICDESPRGRTPPPWFFSLPGVERVEAWSRGLMPATPLARLLGFRVTHVVPGSVTMTIPAAQSSTAGNGQLEIVPVMMGALESACVTALPAGVTLAPIKFTMNPFRPSRPQPGNILARAQVLHSSRLFVFAEVHLEDPEGRHLAHGILQASIHKLDPAPPAPPERIPPVDEPVYETPDPYLRTLGSDAGTRMFHEATDSSEAVAHVGEMPIGQLFSIRLAELERRRSVIALPASEWFAGATPEVSPAILAAVGDMSGWTVATTIRRRGYSVVGLDGIVRFLRPAACDGRELRAESRIAEVAPDTFHVDTTIRTANEEVVATHAGAIMLVESSRLSGSARKETRRVLATLLFVDIVESTQHAERLGDARWRELLEKYRLVVRREVSRHSGVEVDTAGDGFFVRFDSPARAIEAAGAVRAAASSLAIELRCGVHAGECELEGSRLTGMAVHIAARIQAAAEPGEVLVSSTVKDLAVGSGLVFEDRGEHTLKGVPETWRLFRVGSYG